MNYVDIFLLLVMVLAVWAGWKRGFIIGSINLIVWIGSLLAGFFFYQYAGNFLKQVFPRLGEWTLPLAFFFDCCSFKNFFGSHLQSYFTANAT